MPRNLVRATLPACLLVAGVCGLAGCRGPKPVPPAPPPPKVTVARPVPREVVSYREYTGYLEPVKSISIRARVRGFLQRVAFVEGAEVKQGDLLYEIDPREFQASVERARADLSKAEAELRRARAEADRLAKVRGSAAASEEEYQQRLAARDVAQAGVKQASAALEIAQLDLSFTRITSPISGKVNRTLVNEGNLVGYNEPTLLTTVVSMDPMYVYFDVPEEYAVAYDRLARAHRGDDATGSGLRFEVAVANETGFPHAGYLDFDENRVDTGTGTIRVRGVLHNPPPARSLFPGQYARIRVPDGAPQVRLTVPEFALMTEQAGRFLYVVKPDNTVEKRYVTVGTVAGDRAAVTKGLEPGDRVIVNGLQRARPGTPVEPVEEPAAKDAASGR